MHGKKVVMLDPIPTNDPNEPLVCLRSLLATAGSHPSLTLLDIELEHSSEVDQLYHCYGHDYHHLYSVRYATT